MSDTSSRDEASMEELREEVDAHWAKMKAIRLQQADRNESVMDSDFWRPVVMGFVGGSFIGTAVGLTEFLVNARKIAQKVGNAGVPRHLVNSCASKALACSGFFGVYQVTGTALDKFGILSEWSWENAAVSAAVAALPFLRNAASRANLPVFALLVAMERWDKYKVVQRMREEGIKVDTSTGALERV
ncbi:hypothetical protein FNF29_06101 [Cafeteria roenbergensis]|uniref:Mitochondrial import inner membrane translocase subunit TIM22 n=1 Tax=Cafeteria roenbergensis TaxID=33653 RepID=A0A5A8C9Q2_CAFRO|nr:hypothetical protein FNF29_06101 [Cafeteria roenbergensis]|eukprot:KAA0149214.1 hypothetical protein FNF29_06101 [Cafeteria roenbergensis]